MPLQMYQKADKSPATQIKNIIGIAAGKGGVGKSSVTANLARTLKWLGYSVGIMDMDIYGPSIRKMLPEDRMPAQKGSIIIPAACEGILMISMAYFRKENEASVVRAPIANGIVHQFLKNVEWGNLDYLLIDFPPGTGDVQLTLSQHASLSGAVIVTTPQEVAILDVRKAMNMFNQVKVPIIGIVENMSYYIHPATNETVYIFGKGGGERLAQETGVPLLGCIPLDPQLCAIGDSGQSFFKQDSEKNPLAKAFIHLGEKVISNLNTLKNQSENCVQSFSLEWKDMAK